LNSHLALGASFLTPAGRETGTPHQRTSPRAQPKDFERPNVHAPIISLMIPPRPRLYVPKNQTKHTHHLQWFTQNRL
jgi:hypothetical protein